MVKEIMIAKNEKIEENRNLVPFGELEAAEFFYFPKTQAVYYVDVVEDKERLYIFDDGRMDDISNERDDKGFIEVRYDDMVYPCNITIIADIRL